MFKSIKWKWMSEMNKRILFDKWENAWRKKKQNHVNIKEKEYDNLKMWEWNHDWRKMIK